MKISGRGYSIARNDYQWLEWGPSFRVNRQQKIIFCWSIFPECNGFIMGFCYINGLFTGVFSMSLLSLESYVSLDVHVVKMLGSYFQLQLKILAILQMVFTCHHHQFPVISGLYPRVFKVTIPSFNHPFLPTYIIVISPCFMCQSSLSLLKCHVLLLEAQFLAAENPKQWLLNSHWNHHLSC